MIFTGHVSCTTTLIIEFCSFLYRGILKGMLPYKFTNQNHSFTTIYTSTVWISKKGGTGISVEVHVARVASSGQNSTLTPWLDPWL